ncbi:hypothetical protein [Treponema sp. C6A8]|uniref:tetratricopeptide repeat protein n=1 Tax=Treponema sp. C6A8 TaxID=1410609 RepID=UPI0004839C0D|nr:hypothetical protein [Treponema sp. C6A8]
MNKKITACIISLFAFGSLALSALNLSINEDSIKAYREAQLCFESQNYGDALSFCENAILYRKQLSEANKKYLENSMSSRRVQRAGDSISAILAVLEERNEKDSIDVIKYYYMKKGQDFFDDSITKMIDYIDEIKDFPEAQCLIGDIYLMEGEYDFAEQYYLLAIKNAKVLDIPNQKYEIYLKLARISELKKDFGKMEERLLSVLTEDKNYTDKALFSAMMNTVTINRPDSMEKFFQLYRADSYYTIVAYSKLCHYYYGLGENQKALQFALLSVLTDFSRMEEIVASRNIDYTYVSLDHLFYEISLYPDIIEWCNKYDVWNAFSTFCDILITLGYNNFASSVLKVLSASCPEQYWQQHSVLELGKLQKN